MLKYASDAWSFLAGIPGDIGTALGNLWKFTGSLATLLDHIISKVVRSLLSAYLNVISDVLGAMENLQGALERVKAWVYVYDIVPLRSFLLDVIARLAYRLEKQVAALKALEYRLYYASRSYAAHLVSAERAARIADVKNARAYALRLVTALHSAVEKEAADGYNSNTRARVSVITRIADEIAAKNPVVRSLISDFITLLLDFIGASNPVERIALQLLLTQVIDRLGVDKAAGELMSRLLGTLAGDPRPKDLRQVTAALAGRVTALEDQWADFMIAGGPEVEQAGRTWKAYTSLAVDAALLGFFGLAVTDPALWARAVADTAGAAVNDTIDGVSRAVKSV